MEDNTFSLDDVISRVVWDRGGWRKRTKDEQVVLSEGQKQSFVELFGVRRSQETKDCLRAFIEDPVPAGRKLALSRFYDHVIWRGDECYTPPSGHGCSKDEVNKAIRKICKLVQLDAL